MGHTLDTLTTLYRALRANIFTIDYRGYGASKGSPDEQGLTIDADTAINCCLKLPLTNKEKIFIYGKSLGAALAIYSALKYKEQIQGIILDSAYTSVDDLVKENFPKLSYIKGFVLRNHWPNLQRIEKIERPIMIISRKDKFEPHSSVLFNAAKKSVYKEMYKAQEDDLKGYSEKVLGFVEKVMREYSV